MAVQLGVWAFDTEIPEAISLPPISLPFQASDTENTRATGAIKIVYRSFCTTPESLAEVQPHVSSSGLIFTWDGRLDNRNDLAAQLNEEVTTSVPDIFLVGAAFERWGTDCFRKLVGDWALSVWNPQKKALILAKDYIGIRPLFYSLTAQQVTWCSQLATLASQLRCCDIEDEYIAGFLTSYPSTNLTPYKGICAVPAGSMVTIRDRIATTSRYWSFEPKRAIYYKTDHEYEEQFRELFQQAVRRRLRSAHPIAAELSGGLDSSSIVCVADAIAATNSEAPSVETISFYDSASPEADERKYINVIEKKRGRIGTHIDIAKMGGLLCFDYDDVVAAPGLSIRGSGFRTTLADVFQRQDYRVLLSGIGGDEFLGGIPNPTSQLADLIVLPRPLVLARQLIAWSLVKKRPWYHLLFQAVTSLFPAFIRVAASKSLALPVWIDHRFAKRFDMPSRMLGPNCSCGFWKPSRREFAQTVLAMRRQLAYSTYGFGFEERRFPYLDQNLIEFLLAIPANQLLRPGERRSLMRRALAGTVPKEILGRRTKAFGSRHFIVSFQQHWKTLEELFRNPISVQMGYITPDIGDRLQAAKNGEAPQLVPLLKAIHLELWLRSLTKHGIMNFPKQRLKQLD